MRRAGYACVNISVYKLLADRLSNVCAIQSGLVENVGNYSQVVRARHVREELCSKDVIDLIGDSNGARRNTGVWKRAQAAEKIWRSAVRSLSGMLGNGLVRGWFVVNTRKKNKWLIGSAGVSKEEVRRIVNQSVEFPGYRDAPSINHLLGLDVSRELNLGEQCRVISCFPVWRTAVMRSSRRYEAIYCEKSPRDSFLQAGMDFRVNSMFPNIDGGIATAARRKRRRLVVSTAPRHDEGDDTSDRMASCSVGSGCASSPELEWIPDVNTQKDTVDLRIGGLMRDLSQMGFCLVMDVSSVRLRVVWRAIRLTTSGVYK